MSYIVKSIKPDTKAASIQCETRNDIATLPTQTRFGVGDYAKLKVGTSTNCLCTEDWSLWILKANGKYGEFGEDTEV